MKHAFLVILAFTLSSSAAHAMGWLDKVKAAKDCAAGLASAGAQAASDAATSAANQAGEYKRLTPLIEEQIRGFSGGMSNLYGQLCEIGYTGKECSTASAVTLVKEAVPMVIRVVKFEGDLEGVKEGIVLPFLARLRDIREARDQSLPPEELARRLTRLSLFTIEVGFKVPKFVPTAAEASLSGAIGGLTIGLTQGNPALGMAIANQFAGGGEAESGLGKDLTKKLVAAITANIKQALMEPGLTLKQRLDRIISMDDVLVEWFKQVGAAVGWGDLESELSSWRAKNET